MQPSDWLLVFMAGHEGCKLKAYQIIVSQNPLKLDYPTYGFGCVTDFEAKWKTQYRWPADQRTISKSYCTYTGNDPRWVLRDMGQAMQLMRDKLKKSFVPNIKKCFALEGFPDFELTQNQFDAIVSRSWGGCAMDTRKTKLRSLIHAICHYGVYSDQTMFVMSGPCCASGKILGGLVRRRVDEINMLRGHFDPHQPEFLKYCKYLKLNPDNYKAEGVNGQPVTKQDIEAITKRWSDCAAAFVPVRKGPKEPGTIERSEKAMSFKTDWPGIGENPAVTTQNNQTAIGVEQSGGVSNVGSETVGGTQVATSQQIPNNGPAVTVSQSGNTRSIQMGSARRTPTVITDENGVERELTPEEEEAINNKLKTIFNKFSNMNTEEKGETDPDDIGNRVESVQQQGQPAPTKQMETPPREDVPVEEKASDTPNADKAIEDLMSAGTSLPGLDIEAILDKLIEIIEPLAASVKPYLDMISELEKEYDEAEGDSAKEKIKKKLDDMKEKLKNQIMALKNKMRDMVQESIEQILMAFQQLVEILKNVKDMCVAALKSIALPGAIGAVTPNPQKNAADAKVAALQMKSMLEMANTPMLTICQASKRIHWDLPEAVTSLFGTVGGVKQTVGGLIDTATAMGA
ncbi:MAG: hypothetical protein IIZ78_20755 [Clostridiales bacterium]|nr:hypothetical protein [Clostridiales bacterium]